MQGIQISEFQGEGMSQLNAKTTTASQQQTVEMTTLFTSEGNFKDSLEVFHRSSS